MTRVTFLRVRHVLSSPFYLTAWILACVAAGFICGVLYWFKELKDALKDPLAYEKLQQSRAIRQANLARAMATPVGSYDTRP